MIRHFRSYLQAEIRPDVQLILSFEGKGRQAFDSRTLRTKLLRLLDGRSVA